MHGIELRTATDSESEFIFQTIKAAFREYVELTGGWDEPSQRRLHDERFSSQYDIIEHSGCDVGFLATQRQADCLKVSQLFILPRHQSQGVGAAVLGMVAAEADDRGLPIRLRVLKVNTRAISFYHRNGFCTVGETRKHFEMERPSRM